MKKLFIGLAALAIAAMSVGAGAENPKREFRGAWLHTIFQKQYKEKQGAELREYLIDQLDKLQAAGVNAVLFQVRPSADALYPSELEPWSRFLTDGGKAPEPFWDPLQFMIDETHRRGMEFHAWLNPYRVTTSKDEKLASSHIFHREPWRFVDYADNKKYFDPGLPENRTFIEDVVMDIINRYDVDGIHFDDYFYPYPVEGADFPDDKSYAKYGNGMDRGDWRRQNVDLLIEGIHNRIASSAKPWVRFGISPFGIWRNKASDPRGSNTNGLQNYDALYADVLLWDQKGWIDYLLPQLYWELEHKRASTLELNRWWDQAGLRRHLYIGQDAHNIMTHPDIAPSTNPTQLAHKIALSREQKNTHGNCWWPGYTITSNFNGLADSLATTHQSTPAIVPTYDWMSTAVPAAVTEAAYDKAANTLTWKTVAPAGGVNDPVRYVVYRFPLDSKTTDFEKAANIAAITGEKTFKTDKPGLYFVTVLNHVNRESRPSKPVKVTPKK
ncbi:MAG: family 10 glycosylhydrolase [Muribaculaceae bacterium]|nr:family 10 glycosylhydrolase [Muribaculaceae bacterium]